MSSAAVANHDRARFSRAALAQNMKPLWEREMRLQAGTSAVPAIWRWADVRPLLIRGTELITAREAERRVLMLENPGLPGTPFVTTTLFAGLQTILPGEIAPTHRHTPNALRFIMEGEGAYTAVDGERTTMQPGDFIITPSWTWHDHGNPGKDPVVWLDGLDVRIVKLFAAQFHEVLPEDMQPVSRSEGTALARFGNGLAPVGAVSPYGKTSPLFSYPYARSRESLAKIAKDQDPDPCHGWKLEFINPLTGGHAMPTIATFLQLLPKGFRTQPYRSTEGTVYAVAEGAGRAHIAGERFDFEAKDTFVAPSWMPLELEAESDTVLFSFSDRPGQEAMGLWRESRK
jgi:gentisate 1,2-dioxygenase